jgi:hypothetical protein
MLSSSRRDNGRSSNVLVNVLVIDDVDGRCANDRERGMDAAVVLLTRKRAATADAKQSQDGRIDSRLSIFKLKIMVGFYCSKTIGLFWPLHL